MVSKINSHLKEIKFVKSILPITKIIIETATFDPHALKNPEVWTCAENMIIRNSMLRRVF